MANKNNNKQANKANKANKVTAKVTAKEVNNLRKRISEEHKTLRGAIKEVTATDIDLSKREREILAYIGLSKGASDKKRSEAYGKIYTHTPYAYIDKDGKKRPANRHSRKHENGTTTTYYTARSESGWTRNRVLEAIRVVSGDKKQEIVVIEEA